MNSEIWVYINYIRPKISVHSPDCSHPSGKNRVEIANSPEEAEEILSKTRFNQNDFKDLCLALDFHNEEQQERFVAKIPTILARKYSRFRKVHPRDCPLCRSPRKANPTLLDRFEQVLKERDLKDSTIESHVRRVTVFLKWCEENKLDPFSHKNMKQFLNFKMGSVKNSSLKSYEESIKRFQKLMMTTEHMTGKLSDKHNEKRKMNSACPQPGEQPKATSGYLHLSVMVAWHESGWNGRACQCPESNIYCESFGHIRQRKWTYKICLKTPGDPLPKPLDSKPKEKDPACFFENGIFAFDDRYFHLKSAAYGGLGVNDHMLRGKTFPQYERIIEKYIFPLIGTGSLLFLFCRENPLNDERVLCACLKPSSLRTTWFKKNPKELPKPSVEATIKPENVIFIIPYQEMAEALGGYENFPPEFVFEIPKGKRHLFRGMVSLIESEDAISILAGAHQVLNNVKKWANEHRFDWNRFGRQINLDCYIQRTEKEIQRLSATRAQYPGIMGLLWYLEADNAFDNYVKALQTGKEKAFVEQVKAALRKGEINSRIGLTEEAIRKFAERKEWIDFLLDYMLFYPLDGVQVQEIFEQFSVDELSQNPYRLFENFKVPYNGDQSLCNPISFEAIDEGERRRLSPNFDPLRPERCRALLVAGLNLGFQDGHTSLSEDLLKDYIEEISESLPTGSQICFDDLRQVFLHHLNFMRKEVIEEEEASGKRYFSLFRVRIWDRGIEGKVKALLKKDNTDFNLSSDYVKKLLKANGRPEGIPEEVFYRAIENQAQAVMTALQRGLTVITGPAGTGKTTVVKIIVELLMERKSSAKVLLTALTGKAAARLQQVVGIETLTIHRYLAKRGAFDSVFFELKPTREAERFDLVVIDEASMVNTELLWAFLESVETERMLLVGDPRQLPPVEAGSPFKDIISFLNREVPEAVVNLNEILRISSREILSFTEALLKDGKIPKDIADALAKEGTYRKDEFLLIEQFQGNGWQRAVERALDTLGGVQPLRANKVQLITPFNTKGQVNSIRINSFIRCESKFRFAKREYLFVKGDKIIQLKNNWEKRVFNGMMGELIRVTKKNKRIYYLTQFFDDNTIWSDGAEMAHAFCITVHKSQGSEWDTVIVVIPRESNYFASKELLYTALTRTMKKLILLIEEAEFTFKDEPPRGSLLLVEAQPVF